MEYKENIKIGKLTLLEKTNQRKNNYVIWKCLCECGNIVYKTTAFLNNKTSIRQCKECSRKSQGDKISTNPLRRNNKRLYRIAENAYKRCNDKTIKSFKHYGARGIKFEFGTIEKFVNWSLKNGYNDDLTIERIDVDGNYSPNNCCWINKELQAKNKTTTIRYNGLTTYKEIAEDLGITVKTLQAMIYKKKMSIDDIYKESKENPLFYENQYKKSKYKAMKRKTDWKLSKKDVENIIFEIKNGETKTSMSKKYNVDYTTVKKALDRYNKGYYN